MTFNIGGTQAHLGVNATTPYLEVAAMEERFCARMKMKNYIPTLPKAPLN